MSKQLAGIELLAQSTSEQQEEVTTPPKTLEEMNRLADTCREKPYYMKDAAVTDLIYASREAVLLFTIPGLNVCNVY